MPPRYSAREQPTNYWKDIIPYDDIDNFFAIRSAPWVWMSSESPGYLHKNHHKRADGVFNYTLTYRQDSDIYFPYGSVYLSKQKYKQKMLDRGMEDADVHQVFKIGQRKISKEKSKGVLLVMSNCGPKYRNKLVDKFSNLIKYKNGTSALDIYGKCKDGKVLEKDELAILYPQYRFYLGEIIKI